MWFYLCMSRAAAVATTRRGTSRRAGAARDAKRRDRDARRDDPKFAAASATRGGANARARATRGRSIRGASDAREISRRAMGACASKDASEPTRTIVVVSRTPSVTSSASTGDEGGADAAGEEDAAATTRGARDGEARGEVAVVADAPEVEETAREEEERASEVEAEAAREEEAATIEALRRALEATLPASSKTGAGWSSETMKERPYRGGGASTSSGSRSRRARATKASTADVDAYNKSDEEESTPAARPPVDRETAARRARRELRKQARAAAVVQEVSRRDEEDDDQRLPEVVTPRSSLRIKLPPRSTERQKDANRWIAEGKDSYETQLDKLLAVAERAGSTAERVRDEINDLGFRVDNLKLKPVAPWEERGSSWAGDRHSKSARSERSSSAGTILNPKNKNSREMRVKFENVSNNGEGSTPTSPEKPPKLVTSVLRSDLLKSVGEMSTNEKLERLGLKTVFEDEGGVSDDHASAGSPFPVRRSPSTPATNRRVWHERSPAQAKSIYSDEDDYGFAPPPSVGSHRGDANAVESPRNYVEKLKAQAKLARAESAKTWKPGVGVKFGAQL